MLFCSVQAHKYIEIESTLLFPLILKLVYLPKKIIIHG